ncbi:hypothetical protein ACE6H2_023823 [Prunus campanulata]
MRIRKRPVPFPLSSLSPVPLSDPLLHNLNYSPPPPPPMVQLHTHHDHAPAQQKPSNPVEKTARVGHPHPQPSDHHLNQGLLPIGRAEKGWGFSDAAGEDKHKEHNKQDCGLELLILKGEEEEDERGSRDGENNDIRKESILGAETLMGFASGSSSFSHRAVGRWCEGEKAFPLKKRRGSFGRGANMEEKDRKSMKTKMNKKCATQQQNDDYQKQEDEEAKQGLDHANIIVRSNSSATKKRARGSGALMEGSRCSRVNGRGWRCCQQTLVGYSLCEHHLGKGRLRSMTSVRSRSMATTTTSTTTITTSTASIEKDLKRLSASRSSVESPWKEDTKAAVLLDEHDIDEAKGDRDENGGEEEGKPLMVKRKRMKLGIVKARSMSSLLGQINSAIAAVAYEDEDNNNK